MIQKHGLSNHTALQAHSINHFGCWAGTRPYFSHLQSETIQPKKWTTVLRSFTFQNLSYNSACFKELPNQLMLRQHKHPPSFFLFIPIRPLTTKNSTCAGRTPAQWHTGSAQLSWGHSLHSWCPQGRQSHSHHLKERGSTSQKLRAWALDSAKSGFEC